jgi:hypothetical protein
MVPRRPGVPDEQIVCVTVNFDDGRSIAFSTWAGQKYEHFDKVYSYLMGVIQAQAELVETRSALVTELYHGPYDRTWKPEGFFKHNTPGGDDGK